MRSTIPRNPKYLRQTPVYVFMRFLISARTMATFLTARWSETRITDEMSGVSWRFLTREDRCWDESQRIAAWHDTQTRQRETSAWDKEERDTRTQGNRSTISRLRKRFCQLYVRRWLRGASALLTRCRAPSYLELQPRRATVCSRYMPFVTIQDADVEYRASFTPTRRQDSPSAASRTSPRKTSIRYSVHDIFDFDRPVARRPFHGFI